jgi:hypothetical protein
MEAQTFVTRTDNWNSAGTRGSQADAVVVVQMTMDKVVGMLGEKGAKGAGIQPILNRPLVFGQTKAEDRLNASFPRSLEQRVRARGRQGRNRQIGLNPRASKGNAQVQNGLSRSRVLGVAE